MYRPIKKFMNADRQTKFFIIMTVIYMGALLWTTIQSFSRLTYSRSDAEKPIVIPNKQ